MNLLIPYIYLINHLDPKFDEYTYGDSGSRGKKLEKCRQGEHVFFHHSAGGRKFITAYYVVDRVLDLVDICSDPHLTSKYKNPHITEFLEKRKKKAHDDVVLFGDPILSRELRRPLLFDRRLARRLSLNIGFSKSRSESQAIGSATRTWRTLTEDDVEILLSEIELAEKESQPPQEMLSTNEVQELLERDLENLIAKNPGLIGKGLKLKDRQFPTPSGRIDLVFEDSKEHIVIVELKLGRIGRGAVSQVKGYMGCVKKEQKRGVRGIIVCQGVLPTFDQEFRNLKGVRIFCYGWKPSIAPWN